MKTKILSNLTLIVTSLVTLGLLVTLTFLILLQTTPLSGTVIEGLMFINFILLGIFSFSFTCQLGEVLDKIERKHRASSVWSFSDRPKCTTCRCKETKPNLEPCSSCVVFTNYERTTNEDV